VKEAARTALVALACTATVLLAAGRLESLLDLSMSGMCALALAVLLVATAMHFGLHLLVRRCTSQAAAAAAAAASPAP
jgi:hypothetical protein